MLLYAIVYLASLALLLVALGSWLGVVGVALAVSCSALLVALLSLSAAARVLGIRRGELARLGMLPLAATSVLAAVVLGIDTLVTGAGWPSWARLLAEVSAGAVAYSAVVLLRRPGWWARAVLLRRAADVGDATASSREEAA